MARRLGRSYPLRVLVTGAGGFVGKHLLTALRQNPALTLFGTLLDESQREADLAALCADLFPLDLREADSVDKLIKTVQPDHIYHLAGQAFVPRSFEAPWETFDINVHGALNLFEAIRAQQLKTRVLVIGSAEVYGTVRPEQLPITEDAPFAPSSPYSVSKVAQDLLGLQYWLSYHLPIIRVRPFNHIGPGQNGRFAIANWASQIAEIEAGLREPVVYVGDLTAARDFTDVRDVVQAYIDVLNQGEPGSVYNVCSGEAHQMQTILKALLSKSKVHIKIRVDPDRVRPVELPVLLGDSTRLRQQIGWQPRISLEQSLEDVLNEWRAQVGTQAGS